MYKDKTICVVVPAYNEEKQIGKVIERMPDFVDRIVIVDDNSKDETRNIVLRYAVAAKKYPVLKKVNELVKDDYNAAEFAIKKMDEMEFQGFGESEILTGGEEGSRIILIRNKKNTGVGAGIARGYKWAKDNLMDCTVVMAGDGQMDPAELESICKPVVNGEVDYVKGNRLIHKSAWFVIPKVRFFGNSILSILTKIASGYWKVSDTQTGYTAISLKALQAIRTDKIYKRYGMPNDMLVKLNIAYCTIKEVEIKPVYNVGEKSKMRVFTVIPKISLLMMKLFIQRLWVKYLFKDFHPLFLLYHFSFILFLADLPYIYKVLKAVIFGLNLNFEPLFAFLFLTISSFQSLLFAMWMDIQDNDRLYK